MILFSALNNLDELIFFLCAIMFGPPLVLVIIGFAILKKHKSAAKVLFILAVIYLLTGLGICGTLMTS